MFILEIELSVVVRRKTVDGSGALLESLKKVYLLVFFKSRSDTSDAL